ncbi:hypothetical protein KC339_g14603 [Hortaea werneckii]|nr:hypothetical protein KC339_g14603 [Hortaea werneckii]
MAFQLIVDSFPVSPIGPPDSLFFSSLLDSLFAAENGSRSDTQAQPANVFRFQDLPPEMPTKIDNGNEGNRFQVITHGLAYEAQWTDWELRWSGLY